MPLDIISTETKQAATENGAQSPGTHMMRWFANPWGAPRSLVALTWAYLVISTIPIIVAVQFSFNSGRSVTSWQGFSLTRWYFSDPVHSVWADPNLIHALIQSLKLAGLDMLIATPLGVCMALGLARWRGSLSRVSNFIILFPMVTPELVMGVALTLVFLHIYNFITPSTTAQVLGHVTFSLSYVVVIVRGRLFSIGKQYEEAAADLGATPFEILYLVLIPLLSPAIFSSLMIVFALSIDDFVMSQWLSCGAGCNTVPILIYSSIRAAPYPSINALATILMMLTLTAIGIAYFVQFRATRGERKKGGMAAALGSLEV